MYAITYFDHQGGEIVKVCVASCFADCVEDVVNNLGQSDKYRIQTNGKFSELELTVFINDIVIAKVEPYDDMIGATGDGAVMDACNALEGGDAGPIAQLFAPATMSKLVESAVIRVTMDVAYNLNGESAQSLSDKLQNGFANTKGNGLLAGLTGAEVQSARVSTQVVSQSTAGA